VIDCLKKFKQYILKFAFVREDDKINNVISLFFFRDKSGILNTVK